jgi:hypothetical protein
MFMELATAPDNVFKIAPISKKKGIDLMTRRKRNNRRADSDCSRPDNSPVVPAGWARS